LGAGNLELAFDVKPTKHKPPDRFKPDTTRVLDERLAYAMAHAPGGRLVIDQSDFNLFEGWDRPWERCWLTALPGGRFIVHPPGYRPRRHRPRKTSIRSLVAAAEKAGKSVRSIILPDGTQLHFGTPGADRGG
jgi:hypothetical protein